MRRWTDGKSWSASRVSGSFLTYREMEGKRGGSAFDKNANRDGVQGAEGDSDGGPDGYRYKPDGLMKQSFSITTTNGQHLHLISYFSRSATATSGLIHPSTDPQLRHIRPEKGMYPESTVHEQSNIPPVTQGPMTSPGYTHAPNQPQYRPTYQYPGPSGYPPSPMHTPPPHQYTPYYQNPHPGYPGHSPLQNMHYPPPHPGYPPHGMTAYDRPPPMANPHPPHQYPMPPPGYQAYSGYPGTYPYAPPPIQGGSYPPPPPHSAAPPPYANRPAPLPPPQEDSTLKQEGRQDSHQSAKSEESPPSNSSEQAQPSAPASAPAAPSTTATAQAPSTSGQTIPSISAMLNAGENGQPPPRTSSKSPNGTPARPLQDIPSHKLGFEATRDVQALRNLDKSTFKY